MMVHLMKKIFSKNPHVFLLNILMYFALIALLLSMFNEISIASVVVSLIGADAMESHIFKISMRREIKEVVDEEKSRQK